MHSFTLSFNLHSLIALLAYGMEQPGRYLLLYYDLVRNCHTSTRYDE